METTTPTSHPGQFILRSKDGQVELALSPDDIRLIMSALHIKSMLNMGQTSYSFLELPIDYNTHYNTNWQDWLLTVDVIRQLLAQFMIDNANDHTFLSPEDPRVNPKCRRGIELTESLGDLLLKVVKPGLL